VTLVSILPELAGCLALIDRNRAAWQAQIAVAGPAGTPLPSPAAATTPHATPPVAAH
jgi:hypothetical protein